MSSIADAIAQSIGTASHSLHVSGLTYAADNSATVFVGALPESPDVAVSIDTFGGDEADSGLPYDSASLQLIVRGTQDPVTAQDLWYSIYSILHGAVQETLQDGSRLIYCIAIQSAPVPIGPDENGRYRYTMNLRVEWVNATSNRPAPS